MSPKANEDPRTKRVLLEEIERLRIRFDEAEQTLDAIRSGDVDALVVAGPHGDQVFSLTGSERTYRLIVETMNEAALTVGLDGMILFCNQRFCDLVVTPMADAIGKKLTSFVATAQQRSLRMLLADSQDGPAQQQITLQATDGTAVPVLVAANLLEADTSTSICLVMSDLTELEAQASSLQHLRLQQQALEESRADLEATNNALNNSRRAALNVAEDALIVRRHAEEAERRYSALFANKINGIAHCRVLTDEHNRPVDYLFLKINEAHEQIIGIKKTDIEGRRVTEVFPGVENYEFDFIGVLGKIGLEGGEVMTEVFLETTRQYLSVYAYSSLPGEFTTILTDITERKRAEEALKQLNDELENRVAERTAVLKASLEKLEIETAERIQATEALREKEQMLIHQSRQAAMGEMIGNIAHQWRQPLNTLGLTIQQLSLYYDLGEFTKEFMENSVNKSMELIQHMSQTIDDFRNYFKPDKDKVEFKVQETIANTLTLIEDSFKNQHIGVELVAKSDSVIHGFRNEFAQVVLNIMNNARDVLMEREIKDPRVTITIDSKNGRAVVTISDNAGGIPEEIMGKIFDPYFTTKGPQVGTGVGLFMSKTIIESNMGGRLSVRNHGEGAEFTIEV
jgi:PAS domain S-box-containing protein